MAIDSLAFGEYMMQPIFDDCGPPRALVKIVAAVAIGNLNLIFDAVSEIVACCGTNSLILDQLFSHVCDRKYG